MTKISLMGNGFVGSNFARMFPEVEIEPRDITCPINRDVLYTISTVDNYWPIKGDLQKDIDTNLRLLMDVLPNVTGSFTFLSSWFVYGYGTGSAFDCAAHETDCCSPFGFYSITKLAAERLIQSYIATISPTGSQSGPSNYKILRLCNVVGNDPRASKQKGAIHYLAKLVLAGETVPVYDGDCFRDYLHVEDVCRAIDTCMRLAPQNSITNIGRGCSFRTKDLVEYMIARTGSPSKIEVVPTPQFHKTVQVENFWMNTERLYSLGFRPKYSIKDTVDQILTST